MPSWPATTATINDYIFNRKQSDRALPLILIPTTCGTGSEGNGFAVLTNPENGDKKSLRCSAIIAKASIVDPECMQTMPKKVLASVGFDALCHCIEAYTSKIAQPFSDALSLYAIEAIAENLVNLYTGADTSTEAWEKITIASTIGGMVINTAGRHAGARHGTSGQRPERHRARPGSGGADAGGHRVFLSGRTREVHAAFPSCWGGTDAADCAAQVKALLQKLDLTCTLGELGLSESDIPWMAENCMKVSAASVANNPVVFTQEQIADIYRKAL